MAELKHADITQAIIGAAFTVHNTLGNGVTHDYNVFFKGICECFAFQEVIYQRALAIELKNVPLNFIREFEMPIFYSGELIGTRRVDFLIDNKISVELKAIIKLEDVHLAQAINYLEAYNLEIGLLINFGNKRLEFHRFTNKKYDPLLRNSSLSHPSQTSH